LGFNKKSLENFTLDYFLNVNLLIDCAIIAIMVLRHTKTFILQSMILLNHIKGLSEGKIKKCVATNKFLAKAIRKSEQQVERYLKYLKDTDQIIVNTTKLQVDPETYRRFKQREIVLGDAVDSRVFEFQKDIQDIFFGEIRMKKHSLKRLSKKIPLPNLQYPKTYSDGAPYLCKNPAPEEFKAYVDWFKTQTQEDQLNHQLMLSQLPSRTGRMLSNYRKDSNVIRENRQRLYAEIDKRNNFKLAREQRQDAQKNSTEMNQISPQYTSTENQAPKKSTENPHISKALEDVGLAMHVNGTENQAPKKSTENPLKQRRRLAKQRRLDKMHKKPKDLDVVLVPLNQHKTLHLRIRRKSSTDSQSAEHRGP
jgi:hypothetical protein